jgi:hypothetical protein
LTAADRVDAPPQLDGKEGHALQYLQLTVLGVVPARRVAESGQPFFAFCAHIILYMAAFAAFSGIRFRFTERECDRNVLWSGWRNGDVPR